MSLKLMYITNEPKIAKIAEQSDVDWIFIDLEINGKEDRQGHLDTVISRHHISDVKKVKDVLIASELLVRVNPIYKDSKIEIDRVIDDGADIVMLPFFKTREEVEEFISYVDSRARVMLLLETPEAVTNIDSILEIEGIDYIHVGLNDLHLGYGMRFMFELLTDGTVEMLARKIKKKNIPFGFGGVAQLGQGDVPAEYILSEHYNLGSSSVILSRTFYNVNKMDELEKMKKVFFKGIKEIRDYESLLGSKENDFFTQNKMNLNKKIKEVVG